MGAGGVLGLAVVEQPLARFAAREAQAAPTRHPRGAGGRLALIVAITTLAAVGVAGCGDDGGADEPQGSAIGGAEEEPPGSEAACELASPADVEAAAGQPPEYEGRVSPDGTCHYIFSPDSLVLRISAQRSGGAAELERLRGFDGAEDVAGVGDGGVYTEIAGFPVISAAAGDLLVGVSVPDELGRDGAKQLAQTVIDRIESNEGGSP